MYEKQFARLHFLDQLRQFALVRMGRKPIRFYITFYGYAGITSFLIEICRSHGDTMLPN